MFTIFTPRFPNAIALPPPECLIFGCKKKGSPAGTVEKEKDPKHLDKG
jgi:hypothetical protein